MSGSANKAVFLRIKRGASFKGQLLSLFLFVGCLSIGSKLIGSLGVGHSLLALPTHFVIIEQREWAPLGIGVDSFT